MGCKPRGSSSVIFAITLGAEVSSNVIVITILK